MVELNYLLQSSHLDLFEPRGLVTLALVLIVTTMNVMVCREMRNIKFADFAYVYNPDGTLAYIMYSPDTTKKDQGDRTTTMGAKAYKRPLALRVGDGNTKYDLANVLAYIRYHVELLNMDVDTDTLGLFWEMKNKLPRKGESFFFPRVNILVSTDRKILFFLSLSGYGREQLQRAGQNGSQEVWN